MRTVFVFVQVLAYLLGGLLIIDSQVVAAQSNGVVRSSKQRQAEPKSRETSRPVSKKADKLGPIGVFTDVEEGWKSENVQQIVKHFGKGKVTISIAGIAPAGGSFSFSKNQSYYLFQDLFKYTITKKFEFVQYRKVSDGRVEVYAVAERSYRRNDDGRLFKDKIYVSLQKEGDRWVIEQIKSTR